MLRANIVKRVHIVFCLVIIMISTGCSNLAKYYYPYQDCINFQVYEYKCLADSSKTQYWKMTYDEEKKLFLTESYNYKLQRTEYFQERITSSGTQLTEFSEVVANVKEKSHPPTEVDVYKWNDKSMYVYEVKYMGQAGLTIFKKERTFVGSETKRIGIGEYACIKFEEIYYFTLDETGQSEKYKQFTYYAKNMGMIKYERFLPDGSQVELELAKIFDKTEWEALQKSATNKR